MADAVFERVPAGHVATELARGPWDPGHCHGGAPAGLLAALIDAAPTDQPMATVRLTYEILRLVPLDQPLQVEVHPVRPGRRVTVTEAILTVAGGPELVRCRALRIRVGAVPVPADSTQDEPPPLPDPDALPRFDGREDWGVGFWTAVDVRLVEGMIGDPGPGSAWFRPVVPLAEGVDLTPTARAAMAGDFGNGISSPLPMGSWLYVNPDLTVHLHRPPVGDWVGLASRSVVQPEGTGLTAGHLYDRRSRIGTALQSLYVDRPSA